MISYERKDSINPTILHSLWKQQKELIASPPDCIIPILNEEDLTDIQGDIQGPSSTPYEGGLFRVKFSISNGFPSSPPVGLFLTKIYHPNISEKGIICVNTLKKDWNPKKWSLRNLFEVIKCLLIVPFPQSALNEEAGKLFMENYDEYCKIAKIFTQVHAINHNKSQKSHDMIEEFELQHNRTPNPKASQFSLRDRNEEQDDNEPFSIGKALSNQLVKPINNTISFQSFHSQNNIRGNSTTNNINQLESISAMTNISHSLTTQKSHTHKDELKKWLERL